MIDINTILTQALTNAIATAVAEATKPLVERITALETKLAEAAPAPAPAAQVHEAVFMYLDDSESFWHRVGEFVNARVSVATEQIITDAIDAHLENANHLDEDDIDTKIEEAIEQHEENRTHGDADDIEELVQRLLSNATISISV